MDVQFEHSVAITITINDNVKTVTASGLTDDQFNDLQYLCNVEVLKDFKDLRLRRHLCEELSQLGPLDWIHISDLKHYTARSFEPYQPDDDQDIKVRRRSAFDRAFYDVVHDMILMGVIHRCNKQGVKPTKVGHIILDLLFDN